MWRLYAELCDLARLFAELLQPSTKHQQSDALDLHGVSRAQKPRFRNLKQILSTVRLGSSRTWTSYRMKGVEQGVNAVYINMSPLNEFWLFRTVYRTHRERQMQ